MLKVALYSEAGEILEELRVDEARLGGTVHKDLLRQSVLAYEANQRAGTAKTKTRAETSYSGNKPWAQKHTGRARAGTRNSPLWRGGGTTHGPVPRDYSQKLNKKMRARATASAILAKLQAGRVKVLEKIELTEPKTKQMAKILKALGVQRSFLLVLPRHDALLWRCTRNLRGAEMMTASELNAYQVLRARDVIFTQEAFDLAVQRAQKAHPAAAAESPAGEGD